MIYIPSHLQIEPVNRFCDARCPMCTIKFVPDFTKNTKDNLANNGGFSLDAVAPMFTAPKLMGETSHNIDS